MEVDSMPFLLVTANVGSVFEDPSRLLKSWIKEFLSKIALLRPQFLALHLQEVGGKTYEKSMEYVQEFIKNLCESEELSEYNRIQIYLDEDYNSAEHFTALGNVYFIHQTLNTVKIWNFLTHEWETAEGKNIYTGNIEAIATKEKAKFPQHFFPECKWSRKGFLRTRWELNCTVIDLVNIHLFHDASNLAACEEFPSVYCKTRRRALVHTLERFHTDIKNGLAPYFLFGDFNFRCDTEGVIKKLTEDLTAHRVQNTKNDSTKVQYRNSDGENVLTVGKKEFNHTDHQTKFKESWLQQFDRELEPLREVLVEYPITFPPSYPYEEDPDMPKNYMSTRCPAWCDRILMSPSARDLVIDEAFSSTDYNIIGENICMGDHKPVFLSVHVKTLQGTIRCCSCQEHANPPNIFELNNKLVEKHVDINIIDNNDDIKFKRKKSAYPYCLYSSNEFNLILFECRKLDNKIFLPINNENSRVSLSLSKTSSAKATTITNNDENDRIINHNKYPLISINITDTDNYNVCMCPMYFDSNYRNKNNNDNGDETDNKNVKNEHIKEMDGTICPECRNIIKRQPLEHRCTLISKRLMLANNIIVNRIDTHYLNTSLIDNKYEPYTPESIESHSPVPEIEYDNLNNLSSSLEQNNINELDKNQSSSSLSSSFSNNIKKPEESSITTIKSKTLSLKGRGIVSPKQLKSRLENLQRSSLNNNEMNNDDDHNINSFCDDKNHKKNSKSICYKKSCCLIC